MKTSEERRESGRIAVRKYQAANSEKVAAQKAAYRQTPAGRARTLCDSARRRSKVTGLRFTLTPEWVKAQLDAGLCAVTGLPFHLRQTGGANTNPYAPSLDRIDPTLGYTPENTQVVVWMYNTAKGSWTDADVLKMAAALNAH